jgi:hypothetical protein
MGESAVTKAPGSSVLFDDVKLGSGVGGNGLGTRGRNPSPTVFEAGGSADILQKLVKRWMLHRLLTERQLIVNCTQLVPPRPVQRRLFLTKYRQ